jgi:hypothetical protein
MSRVGRVLPGVFVTGGNPDSVNDTLPTATSVGSAYDLRGQFGAILRSRDGTKEWIYAQFSSTSTGKTPAANQLCYWIVGSTANLASPGAWVVDNQTSANSGTNVVDVAGVLRNACTRGNGVWLLRKSSSVAVPVVSTSTVAALSGAVIGSTASGEAVAVVNSTSTTAATNLAPIGWVASTSTAPSFVGSTATGGIGVNIPVFLAIE